MACAAAGPSARRQVVRQQVLAFCLWCRDAPRAARRLCPPRGAGRPIGKRGGRARAHYTFATKRPARPPLVGDARCSEAQPKYPEASVFYGGITGFGSGAVSPPDGAAASSEPRRRSCSVAAFDGAFPLSPRRAQAMSSSRSRRAASSAATYADPYAPEPPYCAYRLRVPASYVADVPEAQGSCCLRLAATRRCFVRGSSTHRQGRHAHSQPT
eukprot:scaffold6997_cov54-Phaeocystis_antarctica.AAC.1